MVDTSGARGEGWQLAVLSTIYTLAVTYLR
jgi:hypothetical protein